jgi:hypothetical protein
MFGLTIFDFKICGSIYQRKYVRFMPILQRLLQANPCVNWAVVGEDFIHPTSSFLTRIQIASANL